jgi:heat shock protein HslJ
MLKYRIFILTAILCVFSLLAVSCTDLPIGQNTSQETSVTSTASSDVNFRFLISDDANAIDKFSSVNITISEIGLHSSGPSANWTTITPDITEVPLKPLTGDNAMEIWSGIIPSGNYTKVFVHVTDVIGILEEEYGGGSPNIKLPGDKLHINKSFMVSDDTVTSFVYDITVVEAGKSAKYILQPQIAQSGAGQKFREVERNKNGDDTEPDDTPVLENTVWILESYGPSDNLTTVLAGTEITVHFDSATDNMTGSTGCNEYFGSYEADSANVTLTSSIVNDVNVCTEPEGIMDQEQEYLAILQNMESYIIDEDRLTVTCGDDILIFKND